MKSVILYASKYGYTKRYAEELSKRLNAEIYAIKEKVNLQNYAQVIYMGGLYAGGINGFKTLLKKLPPKMPLVLITVGIADPKDAKTQRINGNAVKRQVPPEILEHTKTFSLWGGIDYKKMRFIHKQMMGFMYRMMLKKQKKTNEPNVVVDTYNKTVDFVDFETLNPIVEEIQ